MAKYKDVWRDGELYSEKVVEVPEHEDKKGWVVNRNKKDLADRVVIEHIARTQPSYPEPGIDYVHLIDNYDEGWQEMIDFLCSQESRNYFAKCNKLGITAGLWAQYYGAHKKYFTFRIHHFLWFLWPWVIIALIVGGIKLLFF